MTPQAVVLDIGNVLIEWNPERFYDALLGEDARRRFFDETGIHAMNIEVDRGADFLGSVQALARAHPEWQAEIMHWHDSWLELARPAIDQSVRIMRCLQANKVPVFALSNFGIGTFDVACKAYPFLTEFDRSYISGHMGLIKPDSAIYAAVEADCGVAPESLLFTDDRPENLAAAQARGWQVHLFEGADGWADCLARSGLLTDGDVI